MNIKLSNREPKGINIVTNEITNGHFDKCTTSYLSSFLLAFFLLVADFFLLFPLVDAFTVVEVGIVLVTMNEEELFSLVECSIQDRYDIVTLTKLIVNSSIHSNRWGGTRRVYFLIWSRTSVKWFTLYSEEG